MSIIIKGISMPKSCNECILSIEQTCSLSGNIVPNYWERLDRLSDCPLLELPQHGDLIDRDELFPIYADLLDGDDVKPVVPKSIIDTAAVIVPREERT